MSILAPSLVTLAVIAAAVVCARGDAARGRARSAAWSWSLATDRVPSGWHPRWSWPGTGRPVPAAPRVVACTVVDVATSPPEASRAALPGVPGASLPVSPSVPDGSGVPVHVVTGVPLTPREARYGYTVPVTEWAPRVGSWPPITRCEREPFVRVGTGGECRRCTLRRGHPGDCVPGGAS
jgi:hypothetical protein